MSDRAWKPFEKIPPFSQRIHLYSLTPRFVKMRTKSGAVFGTEFGPAKVDSATKNPYRSFFHAGDRTPTSIPQEGRPSWHHARTSLDRPWDSTCHASQQVLHRVGASTPPRHPRAWAHPFATRLLAPTGQSACTCPYRVREKGATSPQLRGTSCRPHLHKAANWQCYRQACVSYHGDGRQRSHRLPPFPAATLPAPYPW